MGTEQKKYITLEELQRHRNRSDLWISVDGKVYDVTKWIDDHPGGEIPLLNLAGQEATDPFLAFHPPSSRKLLDRFFVGHMLSFDNDVHQLSRDYRLLVARLSKLGLFEERGHVVRLSLLLMLSLLSAAVYLVCRTTSPWAHLAAGMMVGFLWTQSGWVAHDSGHGDVAAWWAKRVVNRLVQLLSANCLTGLSMVWWKRTHNAHHVACNSLEFDPDLQHVPLFAVSSKLFGSLTSFFYERRMSFDSFARLLVSHQHLSFYPVMCVARLNLFAQSIVLLLSKRKVPGRFMELVGVMVFWIWYSWLVSCLPSSKERTMFVGACFSVTGIQHILFCLSHFSSSVYVGRPKGEEWCKMQIIGSLNINCPPWMDWFYGGIQFQVEHHLFPRLPRCHLRAVSPAVRELCMKHGLRYESVGFMEANRRTLSTLKAAALQAAKTEDASAVKNLVWEAINIHG
ncbi:hypothetical protein HPP92_024123 [Vanilla planifolia]|uniref:Cytochrome b5 heme-binding domain-containing protein n=1 Tax=Vanilla planifolia TaxID=51239 RepID=A0A835PMB0_VANPL|nr:hypothetical protein HPP92_024123 [Vanilla planifolia]